MTIDDSGDIPVIETNNSEPGYWEITFDFQRIHDLVRQTVTKAPCATFIRRVLASVSSRSNPLVQRGDLEAMFFNILKQRKGGFTRNPISRGAGYGSVEGSIKENGQGNASIFLPKFTDASLQNWSDTQGTIGELMHLAGTKRYTDYDLAVAVSKIPEYASLYNESPKSNPFDSAYIGDAKDKDSAGYSTFFHSVQRRICAVPKED